MVVLGCGSVRVIYDQKTIYNVDFLVKMKEYYLTLGYKPCEAIYKSIDDLRERSELEKKLK